MPLKRTPPSHMPHSMASSATATPFRTVLTRKERKLVIDRELLNRVNLVNICDDMEQNPGGTSGESAKNLVVKGENVDVALAPPSPLPPRSHSAPPPPPPPSPPADRQSVGTSKKSKESVKSTASSVARRKQLELQAAEEKARIQMELIDLRLQTQLALEAGGSSSGSRGNDSTTTSQQDIEQLNVNKWLENGHCKSNCRSKPTVVDHNQPHSLQPVSFAPPPPEPAGMNASTSERLLSRLATPRELPSFGGDCVEWLHFKGAYEVSTNMCQYSDSENLWRLQKALRGEAREEVTDLLIGNTPPAVIMDTLELRFGRAESIVKKLASQLKNLKPLPLTYQQDLFSFSTKINNTVAAMHALNHDEYLRSPELMDAVTAKLPSTLIGRWTDYAFENMSKGRSKLEVLANFLKQEADKLKIVGVSTSTDKQQTNFDYKPKPKSVFVTATEEARKCSFCKKTCHSLPECRVFKRARTKDKWRFAKGQRLCYICLLQRHEKETCTAPMCDVDGCGLPHHRLLHWKKPSSSRTADDSRDRDTTPSIEPATVAHTNHCAHASSVDGDCDARAASTSDVILKVVPVTLRGPNGEVSTYALLDDAASISMIDSELCDSLGLKSESESPIKFVDAFGLEVYQSLTPLVRAKVCGQSDSENSYDIKLRKVDKLSLPMQNLSVINKINDSRLIHVIETTGVCKERVVPRVLIGEDNFFLIAPLEMIHGDQQTPYATRCCLGWSIHGSCGERTLTPGKIGEQIFSLSHSEPDICCDFSELNDLMKNYFTLDSIGISTSRRENSAHVRALTILDETSRFLGNAWEVGMPYKSDEFTMPSTYDYALSRQFTLLKKFDKDLDYAVRYAKEIDRLFSEGYARVLPESEIQTNHPTWYLPHFGIQNPNKPGKLRLVFDAAAKVKGHSLNDFLLTGPDLYNSLLGIMFRFRENAVGITGDIKDMFLKIQIRKEDQNIMRFLWHKNHDLTSARNEKPTVCAMQSLIFGATCSPFIAQYIKNKNALKYETEYPEAVDVIINNHYMDDCVHSTKSSDNATKLISDISEIHKNGGFHIRGWASNDQKVLQNLSSDVLSQSAVSFKDGTDGMSLSQRTLGLLWDPKNDSFSFQISLDRIPPEILSGQLPPTKSKMLSIIMSIYDIHGFISPFIIKSKILLQNVHRTGIDWNSQIRAEEHELWVKWLEELKQLTNLHIPRWYYNAGTWTWCYPKTEVAAAPAPPPHTTPAPEHEPKQHSCALAHSSAAAPPCALAHTHAAATAMHHAPAPQTAPPAPVLQSPSVSYCLDSTVIDTQLHIFSDASIKAYAAVIYWRFTRADGYVCVSFAASKSRVTQLRPVSVPRLELQGALLAARLASTVQTEHKDIKANKRYFWVDSHTVLQWIRSDPRSYKPYVAHRLGEIDELTTMSEWRYVPSKLNVADIATKDDTPPLEWGSLWFEGPGFLRLPENEWPKDLKSSKESTGEERSVLVTATSNHVIAGEKFSSWLRLLRVTARVLLFIKKCQRKPAELDINLMKEAESVVIKNCQQDSFAVEIACLRENKPLPANSRLLSLTPYLEDSGLLRVGGRIDKVAGVDREPTRPVILDGHHHVARLLVDYYHRRALHGANEYVVNELRQRYWVVKLRPTVRAVAARCLFCRYRRAQPQPQRMAALPAARLQHNRRPFSFSGVDFFGPMEVTVGRRRQKRYGILFTCLTIRAIHIEVTESLNTDSTIMAVRRMSARRGTPAVLYSDNGTNLRCADKELKKSLEELNLDRLKEDGTVRGIEWRFIPPGAPEMGGAWERMIRTVKAALKVALKERAPHTETLSTFLTEVEGLVNSRPITHVSVDPNYPEALTPNHFLIGTSSVGPVFGKYDDADLCLRKKWRVAQRLTDMFWSRWTKEYLPTLLPRQKWTTDQRSLKVGDYVILVEPHLERGSWRHGVVSATHAGEDQRVRIVDVRTRTGLLRRPVTRVALLTPVDDSADVSQH